MKILHVIAPALYGGLEQVVHGLTAGLAARGHDVRVACVVGPGEVDHPFLAPLRKEGIAVDVLEIPNRAYRRERAALASLFADVRPDVVHTHGYRCDVVTGAVARRMGLRTVSTAHGFTGADWKNQVYEWLQRREWRRFDVVLAVSAPLKDLLIARGQPASRVRVVRNAWTDPVEAAEADEARAHLGLEPTPMRLGFVGRLNHEKGLDVAARAMAELTDTPAVLAVVGDGPEKEPVLRLARSLGCADRLEWLGFVPRAGHWIRAFDALVLSSRTEGTPIVLLEAIAAGVPIVAAAVGGVPDVVGEGALLVPPEDPAALAMAIRELVADPGAARSRADLALARMREQYALDPWLDAHEDAYRGSDEAEG